MANETPSEKGALQMYVNDMLALQKHILEAVEHQYTDERVKADALTYDLVGKLKSRLTHQVGDLEGEVARIGSGVMATAKAAVTTALGALAGLYDKVRKDPLSRLLRDDYTALNMASFSYTQLHTTGLAFHDEPVAKLALQHLNELTPLIMHINEIIPHVVVKELQDEGPIDASVAPTAVSNTQHAWKPS